MSLAEASEARKARLIALRKRKAGETVGGCVLFHSNWHVVVDWHSLSDEPIIKNRNYDPESRTLKKRTREDDAMMQDTVEKDVEGLAQNIIIEDEQRRAQELVRELSMFQFTCSH
jgi:coiled-coil domain-containing protein 12